MLTRRVLINLGVFAALFVVLCVWALTNVLNLSLFKPPYPLRADLTDVSGLRPGFEVAYLGTHIGKITAVRLAPGVVHLTLAIDQGRKVPVGSAAVAERKSAVGEPFLNVEPPAGSSGEGPAMRPGETIPVSHTTPALQYSDLFNSLSTLLGAVPPTQLHDLIHEMSVALDGRGDDIRTILTQSSELLRTTAANSSSIDAMLTDLSQTAHLLAQNRQAMGSGIDNSAAFLDTIRQAQTNIDTTLEHGPTLTSQVAAIMSQGIRPLACTFSSLGTVFADLGTPAGAANLTQTEKVSPEAANILQHDTDQNGGPWLRTETAANLGTPPVPVYDQRRAAPNPPAVPGCASALETVGGTAGSITAAPGSGGSAPAPHGVAQAPPSATPPPASRIGSDLHHGGRNWLWPLLAALAALGAAAGTARARPWRLLASLLGRTKEN